MEHLKLSEFSGAPFVQLSSCPCSKLVFVLEKLLTAHSLDTGNPLIPLHGNEHGRKRTVWVALRLPGFAWPCCWYALSRTSSGFLASKQKGSVSGDDVLLYLFQTWSQNFASEVSHEAGVGKLHHHWEPWAWGAKWCITKHHKAHVFALVFGTYLCLLEGLEHREKQHSVLMDIAGQGYCLDLSCLLQEGAKSKFDIGRRRSCVIYIIDVHMSRVFSIGLKISHKIDIENGRCRHFPWGRRWA